MNCSKTEKAGGLTARSRQGIRETLSRLHNDIEARLRVIRDSHNDWLCRMGCDTCCRQLADMPRFSAEEWKLLQDGLATLSQEQLQKIEENIAASTGQPGTNFVCPLLDRSAGACMVYSFRPVVCRTYGFYVRRGKGVYCNKIESCVDEGFLAGVIWGNHDAIDQRLNSLGETRELSDWFAERKK